MAGDCIGLGDIGSWGSAIMEMNQTHKTGWVDLDVALSFPETSPARLVRPFRYNLAGVPWLRSLLQSRWPQFLVRALTLAGFIFMIVAGLIGSRVGSHNIAIIFVWIAWWTALKLVFIPFGGRSWCSICPIPLPGEWLQHGGILERKAKGYGLNLRWPSRLRGSWLQWGAFLLIGLFSAVTLTDARVTAWVLLALFGLAIALSLVFERRPFCSYVCPIGGFTGIYAQAAPVELRVLDSSLCAEHREKTCYQSCPWGLYPLALKNSAQCGLCMECLRVCPQDNIAVNLRAFGSDLGQSRSTGRLDEAFLALMMLGSALGFSAVFTGPWGSLKTAAFEIGSPAWLLYALVFLSLNIILMPGLFSLAVWAGGKISSSTVPLRKSVAEQSQILFPLGLCAWIAFTISFAFPKVSYIFTVLSDPLGWGWKLLGSSSPGWSPDVSWFSPMLQAVILLVGLFWSIHVVRQLATTKGKSSLFHMIPVWIFCLTFTLVMLWLLIG
jgi:ferredoxin